MVSKALTGRNRPMPNSHKRLILDGSLRKGRQEKYKLDQLAPARIGEHLVMFEPSEEVIADLMARARLSIPGLAPTSEVIKVQRHNSHCIMALAPKSKFDPAAPAAEGFVAMLALNSVGMELLALDALNATEPNIKFLAKPGERPKAIYLWAIFAPGSGAAGMALFMKKLASEQYAGLDIYARPVTPEGRNFLLVLGFGEGKEIGPHLWVFRRRPDAPLYDSYVPNSGEKNIGITVARTFDDLMRVAAIRNSVYIGEQECPFAEEYDGNDLSATHLLAYIGDEPVGCLRLRFFADFAKFERMAIRKEYRKSRAAIQLARAGFKFCQKKGYRHAYGHIQEKLVPFWSRFGFRVRENSRRILFSDHEYIEIVADIEPDLHAINIGSDPYVIIRPEGTWHRTGILELSALRSVPRRETGKKN
ncbi:MAG TPA: GNAT family N-acetyltransferase [Rhizomicrobium sp.]|nr:GNAT family N-acetyltransferase [Rhizomicrobium sp.]